MLDKVLGKKAPGHIAIVTKGKHSYAESQGLTYDEVYSKSNELLKETISTCVKQGVNTLTFYILNTDGEVLTHYGTIVETMTKFFNSLVNDEFISKHSVKIAVLGKWYDLPGKLVDSIKAVLEKTKEHTGPRVNFCINYDGRQEIVDAVKILSQQVKHDRIDPEMITQDLVKENTYSSQLDPVNLLIVNGQDVISDLLLWDVPGSCVYFTHKKWPEFTKKDLMDAMKTCRS